MKIKFDTEDFTNTHGRSPKGNGNWCFSITLVAATIFVEA